MAMYPKWGTKMDQSLRRRISIASCWASSRVALLDSVERYEDSYAITQEFREWIICLSDQTGESSTPILKVPENLISSLKKGNLDKDEEVVEL